MGKELGSGFLRAASGSAQKDTSGSNLTQKIDPLQSSSHHHTKALNDAF